MTRRRAAAVKPQQHLVLMSVTSALDMVGDKTQALMGWLTGRMADAFLMELDNAYRTGVETLESLRAEAGLEPGQPTPMSMRNESEAAAWRSLATIAHLRSGDRDAARRALMEYRYAKLTFADGTSSVYSDAQRGTVLHDLWDTWLLSEQRPRAPHPELVPYLDRMAEWLDVWQPEVVLAEAIVTNTTFGYAGRTDNVLRMEIPALGLEAASPVVFDLKSSAKSYRLVRGDEVETGPYSEAGAQGAAYGHAERVVRWSEAARRSKPGGSSGLWYYVEPGEVERGDPMPEVAGAVVLHVTPDHAKLHPVDWTPGEDELAWDAFRTALALARIVKSDRWRKLIGPALAPAYRGDLRMPGDTALEGQLRASLAEAGIDPDAPIGELEPEGIEVDADA